jgi:hypothetical protein
MYDVVIRNGDIAQYLHRYETVKADEKIPSGTINEEINAISSFSFTVYPNNPCYDRLQPFSTLVEVYNIGRGRYEFKGRVLSISPRMESDGSVSKSVVCESRTGYLRDSIQPFVAERAYEGDAGRTGLEEFIDTILDNHNAQVEPQKRIYRGIVTVDPFKTSDNVYKGLNYTTTLDAIKDKLVGSFGGEYDVREGEDGKLYFDYVEQFGETRATTIELAKNIESESRDIDLSKIVTRLIPLGTKLTMTVTEGEGDDVREETVESEERLTIASVNGGVPYIEDSNAYAIYGAIYGVQVWDGVTDPNNLKSKGEAWLAANNTAEFSDTVSAVDLSLLGLDFDDFRMYDRYPTKNALIGVNDVLRIVKKTTDVVQAYASKFTLGNTSKLLSDMIVDTDSILAGLVGASSQIRTTVRNNNANVYSYVEKTTADIMRTTDSIIIAASEEKVSQSDFNTFSEIVRNILAVEPDGTSMIFNTIHQAITEVDGRQQTNYSSILKYIRFADGNIILGEEGNAVTLTVENDRISFKQNGVEVAYMSDNKLYIGNAEIKSGGTLQLGNFAFVPRSNGSLSFLKVGG